MTTVLVIGAGKAGTAIARAALDEEHQVRMIEIRSDHVDEVGQRLGGVHVHHGSGTDPSDLEAAGIRACAVVVAATGSDERNLVAATIAKYHFDVPTVLARVVDPRNAWLFEPDMGVDFPIAETELVAAKVRQVLGQRSHVRGEA